MYYYLEREHIEHTFTCMLWKNNYLYVFMRFAFDCKLIINTDPIQVEVMIVVSLQRFNSM
jgi:hypothetical protein